MQSDLFESQDELNRKEEIVEKDLKHFSPKIESGDSSCEVPVGEVYSGHLNKMSTKLTRPVSYSLKDLEMNRLIGRHLKLTFKQHIQCISCGSATNKSFSQGYCYSCFTKKAACDSCIMSPEKCHFDAGTCREAGWGEKYCNQSHYVYLANSSGVKVGITRGTQVPTRWIDQGAAQALPVFRTESRYLSGLVEVILKQHVTDKTNWRTMLKGVPESIDLQEVRDRLLDETKEEIQELLHRYGINSVQPLLHASSVEIDYPVTHYPEKVSSFNFDKDAEVSGLLNGIKGQYLIFDTGVINLRRFTGYEVSIDVIK